MFVYVCLEFMFMGARCLLADMVAAKAKSVRGPAVRGYVRTYVEHLTLNYAKEQELRDRRVEDRANTLNTT